MADDFLRLPTAMGKEAAGRAGGLGRIRGTPRPLPFPLQTSRPAQLAGAGIPELSPEMVREDVPVPVGMPLPEAPEKVGKGKKALRGLRSIIPIIAKLAQGAGTQQPGFLSALGDEYKRSQNEPFMRALADQAFRKEEAGIEGTYAQAAERRAGAERTGVLAGLDPGLAEARMADLESRGMFREIQAEHEKAMTEYRQMYTKYMPEKSRAEIDALVARATAERMKTTLGQYDLDKMLPAERKAVEALTRYRDVQAEELPKRVENQADYYTEEAREKIRIAEGTQSDRRRAESNRSVQSRYQATQKDIDSQQNRRDAEYKIIEKAVGTVPQIAAAKKEIDDKYAPIFAELEARLGNLRFMQNNPDHQPGEGGGPSRESFGVPGGATVLPGTAGMPDDPGAFRDLMRRRQ